MKIVNERKNEMRYGFHFQLSSISFHSSAPLPFSPFPIFQNDKMILILAYQYLGSYEDRLVQNWIKRNFNLMTFEYWFCCPIQVKLRKKERNIGLLFDIFLIWYKGKIYFVCHVFFWILGTCYDDDDDRVSFLLIQVVCCAASVFAE